MARVAVRFDGVSTGAKRAAAETRAAVKSVGDQADRDTKRISLLGPALRRTLQLATLGLTAFAAASVVALKKSADAASNLNEAINATRVTFKRSADDVLAWSKTTATAMGISQRAALEGAAAFGNMLTSAGLATDESAKMSQQLVQLAADMASLHNQDPTEMLIAIRAALAGEAEPLRRFGVLLSEAKVQAEGVTAGLVKKGEALTDAGKMLARYRVILRETSTAHGDAKKTIDEEAGSRRVFNALLEETAAKLGRVFLPAVTSARRAVNEWLQDPENQRRLEQWAETLTDGVGAALEAIADFIREEGPGIKDFLGDVADVVGDVAKVADNVADSVGGWDEVFKFAAITASVNKLLGVAGRGGGAGTGLVGVAAMLTRLKLMGPISIVVAIDYVSGGAVRDIVSDVAGAGGTQTGAGANPYRDRHGVWRGRVDDKPVKDQAHWERRFKAGEIDAQGAYASGAAATSAGRHPDARAGQSGYAFQVPMPGDPRYGKHHSGGKTTGLEHWGQTAHDFFQEPHTPVLAPADGRITRVKPFNRDPAFYGIGIYFVTKTHTFFVTHLESTPGVGWYKRGDVIGRVAAGTQGGPHAHIGFVAGVAKESGAPGTGSGALPPDYEAVETGADTSTTGMGGGRARATVDAEELRSARSTAAFIAKRVDLIASPTLRARIRQRGNVIAKVLEEVTDPKEFARVRRNLNALERDFERAVELTSATKQAQATARNIGSALGRMPEAMQRELGPRLAAIERDLGNVTSKRQLDALKKRLQDMNAMMAAAVDRMRKTVETRRDAFGRAFDAVGDKALQVFDAKTEQLIERAAAKVEDLDARLRGRTPAELELDRFRANREAANRAQSRADALAGASTPEERARLEAQFALEDRERQLEELAALERAALEAEVQAERERRERLAEEERRRIEDERAQLRERFQGRYAEIIRAFQAEELTAEQAQQRLLALLNDPQWAADFADAGALIGAAFAASFQGALDGITAAVRALRAAVQGLADATGQPMPGETPAERALRLRSEEMNRRYGIPFATGGRVPGPLYVAAGDSVMARLTPGEYVLDRGLTERLERFLAGGQSRPVLVDLGGSLFLGANREVADFIADKLAESHYAAGRLAQPITDAQARQITFRSPTV